MYEKKINHSKQFWKFNYKIVVKNIVYGKNLIWDNSILWKSFLLFFFSWFLKNLIDDFEKW